MWFYLKPHGGAKHKWMTAVKLFLASLRFCTSFFNLSYPHIYATLWFYNVFASISALPFVVLSLDLYFFKLEKLQNLIILKEWFLNLNFKLPAQTFIIQHNHRYLCSPSFVHKILVHDYRALPIITHLAVVLPLHTLLHSACPFFFLNLSFMFSSLATHCLSFSLDT